MKKTILLTFLFCIFLLIVVQLLNAQTLVASYPFNGNANDAAGTANGTVHGASLTTDRLGNPNSAYNFDGINNYIDAVADALPTGDNTISLWFNADIGSIANRPGLLGYGGNAGGSCPGNSDLLIINLSGSAKYTTQAHCLNNYADYAYSTLPENNWYNWVVTKNGTTIKMYINGVLVSTSNTATESVIVAGMKLSIGAVVGPNGVADFVDGNVGRFKGKLDDIKIYNGALNDDQILHDYLSESLVASYPFNGNANDGSGNGNNGSIMGTGVTLTTDRFGNANSAYNFNGDVSGNSFINVPNSTSLQLTNSYTISAWVKPSAFVTENTQHNFILQKGDVTSEASYSLFYTDALDNNTAVLTPEQETFFTGITKGGNAQYAYENPVTRPVELSKWYYVVSTYDGTTNKLYVNCKLRASSTPTGIPGAPNASPLVIGKTLQFGYTWAVNGVIDDIKIYNAPISSAQIFDTYVNDLKKPGSGKSILFDNTLKQIVDVGNGFDQAGSFSFETWIKRTNTNVTDLNSQTFMASQLNNGWSIGINQSSPADRIYISKVGLSQVVSTSSITDTKWHHVAVTFNAGTNQVVFYIDGVADAPISYNPGGFITLNSTYRIGGRNNGSGVDNNLNGSLDEVRVWSGVVLTQAEVRDWMCKKISSSHPEFTNLQGYFRLDEGTGTMTGGYNAKFGTLTNGPTWQTSGASIGDASAHDYVNATKTANISHASGENFAVTSTSGSPTGIQVYRVDEQPNTLNGASGVGLNNKYFGVFQVNGTTPQYTAEYNYTGNPYVNAGNESQLRLNKRADNNAVTWTVINTLPNEPANTIIVTGESTEYILGKIGSPLPITIISFNGVRQDNSVKLTWETENEIDFSNFEVQRSTGNNVWQTIATINAGNTGGRNNYTATDVNPDKGINLYRLKENDKTGTYKYSGIVKINFAKVFNVTAYPNPATNQIIIQADKKITSINLADLNGRVIKEFSISNNNTYDISTIPSGVYFLKIYNGENAQVIKIIKK